ncbi:VAO-type flavoprotein oxidase [Paramyrothecium foliicola]|nr:VAO-type flavoprotein oxidase [Paramyrothecium foliicola]
MNVNYGLLGALILSVGFGEAASKCKAVPGSSAWPSTDKWRKLNETVEGRLFRPTPPAAVCHSERPEFNEEACAAVTKAWEGHDFHTYDPVSTLWNNWNNDTCLPDPKFPCSGDGYPALVVNATTAEHVKAAVDFARKHNIRLVVKNTGHDFAGRSVAPNALSIWTHHMTSRSFDDKEFKPRGCKKSIKGATITIGPGNQLFPLYEYTNQFNHTLVAGNGKTVGAGGYYTGGGHSVLSGKYGLGVDQILEMELVTPKGKIIKLNECQNEDLFFALRGAGGSTYGVVTSFTMKVYPTPKMATLLFRLFTAPNTTAAADTGALVYSKLGELVNDGFNGYAFSFSQGFDPLDFNSGLHGGAFGILVDVGSEDTGRLVEAFAPIAAEAKKRWGCDNVVLKADEIVYPTMLDFISVWHDTSTSGKDRYTDASLVSAEGLATKPEKLIEANLRSVSRGVGSTFGALVIGGKGIHEAKPRGGRTAVHPAWRKSVALLYATQDFEPFNEASRLATVDVLQNAIQPLREMPDAGAYVNEAVIYHDDWQHHFWGDLYEELLEIKRKHDPEDVFWCHPCVGSERWEEIDGQLCRI